MLLKHGADVTAVDKDGHSVVNIAAANGHLPVVERLLEETVDLSVANIYRDTPLSLAARHGHAEVVQLLLRKGAYTSSRGRIATYETIINLFAFKGLTESLRFLVEHHNVDLRRADTHGRTLLHFAARGGYVDTCRFLAAQGVDVSALDAKGDNIVDFAASSGSKEILDWMLTHDVAPSEESWSPLHWACRAGGAELVECLITRGLRGGSVVVPEMQGEWPPLAIAVSHGHGEMLGKLSEASQAALDFESGNAFLERERQGSVTCDACFHLSIIICETNLY